MRINGQWLLSDEGVVRPIFRGTILTAAGVWEEVEFLADSGADKTVLTAAVLAMTGLPTASYPYRLVGAGGLVSFVAIETKFSFLVRGAGPRYSRGGLPPSRNRPTWT